MATEPANKSLVLTDESGNYAFQNARGTWFKGTKSGDGETILTAQDAKPEELGAERVMNRAHLDGLLKAHKRLSTKLSDFDQILNGKVNDDGDCTAMDYEPEATA